jgi:hypothetical protein
MRSLQASSNAAFPNHASLIRAAYRKFADGTGMSLRDERFDCKGMETMPDKAFRAGYVAGWRSVRGGDNISAVPPRPKGTVESAFRCGVTQGVADAIRSGSVATAACDEGIHLDAWFDRVLQRS